MTPLIGITTYSDLARWRDWAVPAAVLPRTYVDAVRRGGGRPVLLSPGGGAAEAAATAADLDGLIVSGGGDVDPSRYGAAMHPATGAPNAERDAWELALLDSALQAGLPVLAVCRGMQLLNVVRGGTLHQHLPHVVGHEEHSGIADDFGRHMVRIGEAGAIGRILTPEDTGADGARPDGSGADGFDWPARDGHWIEVPTHHHQAVDQLGAGLVATAWAADGTVEALEFADAPSAAGAAEPGAGTAGAAGFAIGVQWHPEEGNDPRLFRALASAAMEPRGRPADVSAGTASRLRRADRYRPSDNTPASHRINDHRRCKQDAGHWPGSQIPQTAIDPAQQRRGTGEVVAADRSRRGRPHPSR